LNDEQEAIYALKQVSSAVRGMSNPAAEPEHSVHNAADEFGQVFDAYRELVLDELGALSFPVYVASFCESGDLLSQWRAYGTDHGYAIEFDAALLKSAVSELEGYEPSRMLAKVRYGYDSAVETVHSAQAALVSDTNLGHYGVHAHYMALQLTALLASVKHPGFKEEQEWRIIAGYEYSDPAVVQFRSSSVAIVPYIIIPFSKAAVVSVRVGPGRHTDVRQEGVRRLLQKHQYDTEVTHSEVPLRT